MKRASFIAALLLPLVAWAGLVVQSGPRLFVVESEQQEVGSLSFSGGASTANSPTVRMARTGANDWNSGTVEFFFAPSATDADNGQEIAEGANYNLTDSNIILDADSFGTRGYIFGLSGGQLCFGINTAGGSRTICGGPDTRDGQFHHGAGTRNSSTGLMELFVDGSRVDTVTGPTGLITYDGDAPTTDSFDYWGKEKLNATFGFDGLISEIRKSTTQRYSGTTYTVPSAPFTTDGNTVALYHMDEQTGTTLGDSSGNNFDGTLLGSPVPTWSSSNPF